MRILLIHQYFLEQGAPGGTRFNEIAKRWVEQGHEITVIAGMINYVTGNADEKYKNKKFHSSYYQPGLEVIRAFVSGDYNKSFSGRLWAYFSFVLYGSWAGLFRATGKYDMVLATSPPLFIGLMAWIISRWKRIPYVFEVRDLWPESAIETGVIKNKTIIRLSYWLEGFIYRNASFINVLTPAFRDSLVNKKNIPASKITLIPNAADFALSNRMLSEIDIALFRHQQGWEGKFVAVYVGAHGVANGLDQLIRVAEKMINSPVLIVLIGDGMEKGRLVAESEEKKLTNIRFVDSVSKFDVLKFIIGADLGISVLKKADTFKTVYSNKTFDYMSCKRPVLMVIDGVSRALVEDSQCGLYAEPEHISDICEKLSYFVNHKEESEKMGLSGYNFALANFDRGILADKYLNEIQRRLNVL